MHEENCIYQYSKLKKKKKSKKVFQDFLMQEYYVHRLVVETIDNFTVWETAELLQYTCISCNRKRGNIRRFPDERPTFRTMLLPISAEVPVFCYCCVYDRNNIHSNFIGHVLSLSSQVFLANSPTSRDVTNSIDSS